MKKNAVKIQGAGEGNRSIGDCKTKNLQQHFILQTLQRHLIGQVWAFAGQPNWIAYIWVGEGIQKHDLLLCREINQNNFFFFEYSLHLPRHKHSENQEAFLLNEIKSQYVLQLHMTHLCHQWEFGLLKWIRINMKENPHMHTDLEVWSPIAIVSFYRSALSHSTTGDCT